MMGIRLMKFQQWRRICHEVSGKVQADYWNFDRSGYCTTSKPLADAIAEQQS